MSIPQKGCKYFQFCLVHESGKQHQIKGEFDENCRAASIRDKTMQNNSWHNYN